MQPPLVAPADENLSFISRIERDVRANFIWLGRSCTAFYRSVSPEVIRVARKILDSFLPLVILQLFSWETRLICYLIAAVAAMSSCIAKIDWATAKIFRPFIFSIAADLVRVAALSYVTEPFPSDIIVGGYMLFYAGLVSMIATNLEEIFPEHMP